jgi:hypothetical protein
VETGEDSSSDDEYGYGTHQIWKTNLNKIWNE